jgi:putative ATP-binding cassette transporter
MRELNALLRGIGRRRGVRLVILSALAGLSNVGMLALLNSAAADASMARGTRKLVLILLLIAIYRIAQREVMTSASRDIETILHRTRLSLLNKVLQADLMPLEEIGRQEILGGIARHPQTISDSVTILLVGVQSAILLLFVLFYIGTLSMTAFLLTTGLIAVMLAVQRASSRMAQGDLQSAATAENRLFGNVRDLLDGFKEVKMNRARGQALLAELREQANGVAANMSRMRRRTAEQFVFGQAGLLVMLGATVFLAPLVAPSSGAVIVRITTAILFVIGSVGLLVQSGPVLAQAEDAAANIARLEARLDAAVAASAVPAEPASALPVNFETLVLESLQFRYPARGDEPGFGIGPLDLMLRRGEMIFITGGNGTGKSTLLRLLTGLYHPAAGHIRLDEAMVTVANQQAYRNMISTVFGDYHLFRRLYVMPPGGVELVEERLHAMELSGKTALQDDRFTSLDLSAGQRRRLALLVALLQDRPILVLDEVAADFDPSFRRHFYEEMLPALKARGKTIVAASHDDRFFHVADRIVQLEDGRIHAKHGLPA